MTIQTRYLIKEMWQDNDHRCQVFALPTKESGLDVYLCGTFLPPVVQMFLCEYLGKAVTNNVCLYRNTDCYSGVPVTFCVTKREYVYSYLL